MPSTGELPDYEPGEATFEDVDLDLSAAEGIPSGASPGEKAKKAKRKLAKMEAEDKANNGGGEERKHPKSGKAKVDIAGFTSMDDVGNARWLLKEYGEDMRWDASIGEWVIWKDPRWEVDSHEAVRRAITISEKILAKARAMKLSAEDETAGGKLEAWGLQCGNISRIKAMLEIAKSMPGIAVSGDEFNADKRLIACPNGTIVLGRDGAEFRESRKDDLTTRVAGCEYIEGAVSPMFQDFLEKFLPEPELRAWAQKVAGYSMIGGNPKRRIVFCWGPTSSGKSTFAELIKLALGTYAGPFNLSMLRENQDERPRPDLVTAISQRTIFASEASSDWHLHADMIKRVTGQDETLARLPHSGVGIRKIPDFTPWIITNNIPTINGADQALYRRLCTVLFPHSIPEENENEEFKDDLRDNGELPGILAWLVEGWNMYCDNGLSDPPHRVVTAEMRMREQFSDIDVFLSEVCEKGTGEEYRCIPSDLFQAYEMWADDNGVKGRDRLTNTAFGRALTGRGFAMKHIKENGKSVRRRLGLRLKSG